MKKRDTEPLIIITSPPPTVALQRSGTITAILYALLTLPTLHLISTARNNGESIARLITETWHATFWSEFFPIKHWGTIALDGSVFIIIALVGGLYFWQAKRFIEPDIESEPDSKNADEARPSREIPLISILIWTALFGLILIWVVPFHSQDIYGYINRGIQQSIYGLNPYLHPLADVPQWQDNPVFHKHWVDNPSPYGVFFTQFTQWVCTLGMGNFSLIFIFFKLSSLTLHLINTTFIFHLARRFNSDRPWLQAWLYAWNPLMLLHMVANGHNDLWVATGLLGALSLLCYANDQKTKQPKGKPWHYLSLPLLAISIFTKYASALALPFIALYLIQRGDHKTLIRSGLLAVIVVALLALPYISDLQHLPFTAIGQNAGITQHSLNSFLARIVDYSRPLLPSLQYVASDIKTLQNVFKPYLWGGFFIYFSWQLWSFWRRGNILQQYEKTQLQATAQENDNNPTAQSTPKVSSYAELSLVFSIATVMLIMLTIASPKFNSWYIAMVFPLLFLLPRDTWAYRFGFILSGFQLLAFTPIENLHILNYTLLTLTPLFFSLRHRFTTKKA